MSKIIDISLPIHEDMVVWPGSPKTEVRQITALEIHGVNGTSLSCDSHVGTHIDAPLHFIDKGSSIDKAPLSSLIGPAVVVQLSDVEKIDAKALNSMDLAGDVKRLLFKTDNSTFWADDNSEFRSDYAALTPDGAQWVVDRHILLVGVDYLSVGRYKHDGRQTHKILLNSGVVILEGLNLSGVKPGNYELICLPLKVLGAEGAPARAVLRTG